MRALPLLLLLVILSGTARAEKSAVVAEVIPLAVTVGATAVVLLGIEADTPSILTIVAGVAMITGPSFGHFYAGELGRGLAGIGLRAAGLVIVLAGTGEDSNAGLMIAGLTVIAGSMLWDLVDAPFAAKRANRRGMRVVPAALPSTSGPAPAILILGRF